MMGLTEQARTTALRAVFPGTGRYVALFTTLPTAYDGSGAVEAAGSNYARAAAGTWDDEQIDSPNNITGIKNSAEVAFPTLDDALGPIVGAGIFDASSGGNLLAFGPLLDVDFNPISRSFASGDTPKFPAATLLIGLAESFS